jgi:hypothetical protein
MKGKILKALRALALSRPFTACGPAIGSEYAIGADLSFNFTPRRLASDRAVAIAQFQLDSSGFPS